MAKKKLIHFEENLTFPHLIQPTYKELEAGFTFRSRWNELFFRNGHPIIVELGCGKGEYTVGLARKHPELNFIGIDMKGARLWRGCKTVEEEHLPNVAFIRTRVDHMLKLFGPAEISAIWITFPDPQKGKERLRLTSPCFLAKYEQILTDDGVIHLKTDDDQFFAYSLSVVNRFSHRIIRNTGDLYDSSLEDEVREIQTFYEMKWLAAGKKICYLSFNLRRP